MSLKSIRKIKLTQGKYALIDAEDFEKIKQFKWHFADGYAKRGVWLNKKQYILRLHWDIVGKPKKGLEVDHINGNKLDNRKENLRIVPHYSNLLNKAKMKNGRNKFKGIYFQKDGQRKNRWLTKITLNKKTFRIGSFPTEIAAAMAYDIAAKDLHGEFARLNFS